MRILFLLLLSIMVASAQKVVQYDSATQNLLQTNIFASNLIAGANITITKGSKGQLTIASAATSASTTNFDGIFVTNNIFGTNYIYAVNTNKPNGIVSFEWLTNIVSGFESTTSNGAVAFTMSASNTLQGTFVANDTITSNALRTLLIGNDTITSNGVVTLLIANDTITSNALRTLLIANDTITSNGIVSLVGETNFNGEVSITNATRMGLVYDKVGITNRLRSVQGGNGVILTNQGTNIMLAIDPSVVPASSAVLSNLSSNPYTGYTNQVFGGSNINVRTIGGTNFIDTTGNLNNWALIPTNFFLYHTNDTLTSWTASQMYQLTVLKRDTNSVITNATVLWPDGSAGIFTCTSNNPFWSTIDSYTVTYAGLSKTITQSTVIRDNFGAITNKPALVVTP